MPGPATCLQQLRQASDSESVPTSQRPAKMAQIGSQILILKTTHHHQNRQRCGPQQNVLVPCEMAAAIAALRKINQRNIVKDEAGEDGMLLGLITRLPPKELWVEEHDLGILVLR